MLLRVVHRTTYQYTSAVTLGHSQLRLTPRTFHRQRTLSSRVTITPGPSTRRDWTDCYGNDAIYFTLEEPHRELSIESRALVDVFVGSQLPVNDTQPWEYTRSVLRTPETPEAIEAQAFLFDSFRAERSPEALDYALPSFRAGISLTDAVRDLTSRIYRDFRYDPAATNIHTTTKHLLGDRRGVCQDFAHLEIACLRSLGLAARYISGYMLTRPPPGKVKMVGADASHAWVSVYFPERGWIDLDPTNDRTPGDDYITLGWGRDYDDVSPARGLVLGGGGGRLAVSVDVAEQPANLGRVPL